MRKFLIIVVIALSLSFVLFREGDRTREYVLPQQQAPLEIMQSLTKQALLNITLGFPDAKYEVLIPQGSTVYDLLGKASLQYGFSFSGKSFPGMGFFVEEVNGLRQNPRTGKYWIYYINSRKAEVGISVYQLKTHDVISWKYEDEE